MRLRLGAEVAQVDVAVVVAGDDHDTHPGHRRTGRVRPMCRRGDQDYVSPVLALVTLIGPDDHEPGELTLSPRIRLQ